MRPQGPPTETGLVAPDFTIVTRWKTVPGRIRSRGDLGELNGLLLYMTPPPPRTQGA